MLTANYTNYTSMVTLDAYNGSCVGRAHANNVADGMVLALYDDCHRIRDLGLNDTGHPSYTEAWVVGTVSACGWERDSAYFCMLSSSGSRQASKSSGLFIEQSEPTACAEYVCTDLGR